MTKTNHQSGHDAEEVAAEYLRLLGYEVEELNWRTPVCEIDIVAKKASVIYFVEVKYRLSSRQGTGFDYITQKKLRQMEFAAQCWVEGARYDGDYRLSAIEVSGDYKITAFLSDIT